MRQQPRTIGWQWSLEAWGVVGIIILSAGAALLTLGRSAPSGGWGTMVQFALGGWPEHAKTLSAGDIAWGVFWQVAFALGIPLAFVAFLRAAFRRSTPVQLTDYISRRDNFMQVLVYRTLRKRLSKGPIQSIDECDRLTQEALGNAEELWQQHLDELLKRSVKETELKGGPRVEG